MRLVMLSEVGRSQDRPAQSKHPYLSVTPS
jgi:hypothetical protein